MALKENINEIRSSLVSELNAGIWTPNEARLALDGDEHPDPSMNEIKKNGE
jgi:hypothetical protein